jgi:addiction module RelE/StbE family toxin
VISPHFHKQFKKQYKKAPTIIRRNFDERLQIFVRDRTHIILNNHPLAGERKGEWSINVTGDWRAIYEYVDDSAIIFLEINTHGNLYKK